MKEAKPNSIESAFGSERRGCARYQIRGTAWFQWETQEGHCHEGTGATHDISKAGAFIETQTRPPVGARVKVSVSIASGVRYDMQIRLCGAGDVRHLQHDRMINSGFGAFVAFRTEGTASAE